MSLYATQALVLVVSVLLIWLLPLSWEDINWIDENAGGAVAIGVALSLFVVGIDYVIAKLVPFRFLDDGGINERIFQDRNVPHIAFLAFVIAFSEELLFRGVLQSQFGIVISSIIFTAIHFRYLKQWILLLSISVISLSLGLLVHYTTILLPAIIAHFLIDFILGVLIRYKLMPKR